MGQIAETLKPKLAEISKQLESLQAAASKGVSGHGELILASGRFQGGTSAIDATDPYQGKGLAFARAVRVKIAAQVFNRSEDDVWHELKNQDRAGLFTENVRKTTKALGESAFGGGGVFVPDELSLEFIDVLRPRLAMLKAGVERVPMSRETMTFARESAAAVPQWIGENQAAAYSQQTFDSPQLQLKKLAVLTAVSNDLLRDAAIAADVIVRNDLVKQALLALDLAMIRGLGSAASPKGVRYIIPAATNVVSSQVGAGSPTYAFGLGDLYKCFTVLDQANVPDVRRFFLFSPRTKNGLAQLKDGVGGTPFGREMAESKTLLGLPFFTTTQIPNNLSGGGSGGSLESEITCAEASELVYGEGMQPTIDVERNGTYLDQNAVIQSGLSNDQTAIRMILRADFIMKHQLSAVVIQGCTY
jgi:HK97 family phage major capsid protein